MWRCLGRQLSRQARCCKPRYGRRNTQQLGDVMKSLAVIALLFVSLAAAAQTIPVLPQLPDPVVPLPVAPAPQPITPAPTPVPLTPVPQAAAAENVWVKGTYLTDSDGYQYGMSFTVNSNYSVEVCVFPYVKDSDNVNGAVTPGPIQLKPG